MLSAQAVDTMHAVAGLMALWRPETWLNVRVCCCCLTQAELSVSQTVLQQREAELQKQEAEHSNKVCMHARLGVFCLAVTHTLWWCYVDLCRTTL
jgi:Tfp pilus assembly protein PilV